MELELEPWSFGRFSYFLSFLSRHQAAYFNAVLDERVCMHMECV